MLTPIIKASNKTDVISFYNMTDYEKWLETDIAKKGNWKIKYYKAYLVQVVIKKQKNISKI